MIKPKQQRHDALRKEIAGWYDGENATVGFVAQGAEFGVIVGPRARERRVTNMARLAKLLGKRLVDYCTVPLSAIDRLFDAEQQKEFITESQTGSRTVRVIPKAQAAA